MGCILVDILLVEVDMLLVEVESLLVVVESRLVEGTLLVEVGIVLEGHILVVLEGIPSEDVDLEEGILVVLGAFPSVGDIVGSEDMRSRSSIL